MNPLQEPKIASTELPNNNIIMDFIEHPILVKPFLKCCTYIK